MMQYSEVEEMVSVVQARSLDAGKGWSVRYHASCWRSFHIWWADRHCHVFGSRWSVWGQRTVFRLLAERRTECISMSAVELRSILSKLAHLSLASKGMLFGIHLHIILRKAATTIFIEEATITSIKNIYLWIAETRIILNIEGAILLTYITSHDRGTVSGVFTVEDEQSLSR